MKTLEQLQAEHAKQIEALKAQHAIGQIFTDAGLPVPEYIGGKLYGAIGVTYRKIGALTAAIDLMTRFPVLVPFAVLRDGCTILAPESAIKASEKKRNYKRDVTRNGADYACQIDVRHINDSPAPTFATLNFYARVRGVLFSVSIEFGKGYIDSCPRLAPQYVINRGRNGRIESATFNANPIVYSMADSLLVYASGDMGPVKTSANHHYLFVSDYGDDECKPAEGATHAIDQLRNLAAQIGE